MNEIVKLMIDAYRGNAVGTDYSNQDSCETLRKALLEICGTDKVDYKVLRKHGPAIYELIEEALDEIIPNTVEEQFNEFAEVKSYKFGDKPVFTEEDTALFNIAVISEGNNNLRSQKLWTGRNSFSPDTQWMGAKLRGELMEFLTGRKDWPATVAKIAESWNEQFRLHVYNTFIATYSTINAPYAETGAITVDNLAMLISHVEAASKRQAVIVGTKVALSKVPTSVVTEQAGNIKNQMGHFGTFQGTTMRELTQGYTQNTTNWALDNTKLLILPSGGVKPVKILLEGTAMIRENNDANNVDEHIEYLFKKKAGVAVLQSIQYGIFQLS